MAICRKNSPSPKQFICTYAYHLKNMRAENCISACKVQFLKTTFTAKRKSITSSNIFILASEWWLLRKVLTKCTIRTLPELSKFEEWSRLSHSQEIKEIHLFLLSRPLHYTSPNILLWHFVKFVLCCCCRCWTSVREFVESKISATSHDLTLTTQKPQLLFLFYYENRKIQASATIMPLTLYCWPMECTSENNTAHIKQPPF